VGYRYSVKEYRIFVLKQGQQFEFEYYGGEAIDHNVKNRSQKNRDEGVNWKQLVPHSVYLALVPFSLRITLISH
jgi:hypothetical protein